MANLKLDYQKNMEKNCRDRKSQTMDGQKGKGKDSSQRQTNGGSASGPCVPLGMKRIGDVR